MIFCDGSGGDGADGRYPEGGQPALQRELAGGFQASVLKTFLMFVNVSIVVKIRMDPPPTPPCMEGSIYYWRLKSWLMNNV